MTPDRVLRPHVGVDAVEIAGEVLLYDGIHLRLLPTTAAQIWLRADGATPAAVIARELAARHDDRAGVAADVLAFLAELLDNRALELVPVGAASYRRSRSTGWVRDGDTVLLVDLPTGRRRALAGTGSRIWELVGDGASADDVTSALRGEYPDAPASVAADVAQLLDLLTAEGFLLHHGAGVAPSST